MKKQKAFTLIEILVVIAIIGIIATIAIVALQQARQNARDAKRVADVKQMSTALEMYFNDHQAYPDSLSDLEEAGYMQMLPEAPTTADKGCEDSNDYFYSISENRDFYHLRFCTGKQVADLSPGNLCMTPGGLTIHCAKEEVDEGLKNGLRLYYKLDGNSVDSLGNENGTDYNMAYPDGKIGQCGEFNRAYISFEATSLPTGNSPRTLNFWINVPDHSLSQVFLYGEMYKHSRCFAVQKTSAKFRFQVYGTNSGYSLTPILANTWYMFTVTYDNGSVQMFLDGEFDGSSTINIADTDNQGGLIGRGWDGYFHGFLDEIALWDRVLSQEEIMMLYNQGDGLAYPF